MIHDFWLFALTGLLLNLTPGNDMLYVIARTTGQGVKAGVVSALGIGAGCMIHILAAVAGLSAVIAGSTAAFNIIKYAGAAYLVYLGLRSLLTAGKQVEANRGIQMLPLRKIFWQGALTNILNPKVALFFLAFLPQFIDPHAANSWLGVLLLGAWFDLVGTIVNILVALLAGSLGKYIYGSRGYMKWQQKVTGFVLIALGIRLAADMKK